MLQDTQPLIIIGAITKGKKWHHMTTFTTFCKIHAGRYNTYEITTETCPFCFSQSASLLYRSFSGDVTAL